MPLAVRTRRQLEYVPIGGGTSVGPAGEELKQMENQLRLMLSQSEFLGRKYAFWQLLYRARQLRKLAWGWDSYGAEPPNETALENIEQVINLIESTSMPRPSAVSPSAEGGIGLCFVAGDRYADIECLNTGEILAVRYAGNQKPIVWELDATTISKSLEQIREHVSA